MVYETRVQEEAHPDFSPVFTNSVLARILKNVTNVSDESHLHYYSLLSAAITNTAHGETEVAETEFLVILMAYSLQRRLIARALGRMLVRLFPVAGVLPMVLSALDVAGASALDIMTCDLVCVSVSLPLFFQSYQSY